ncbi:uncharacterized protein LOC130092587 [Rhinichthys klamathensis goyatoka]|uniref:uncharacterized protein LOC130092587 n=1 Tax=Rhinichthys klamathensis goyatoka TaxID=3034132 RepID=UPI0024B56694|nr:uncharacterized protein LOC130092587 [Rhinichthys klamathensis goyatoka]
MDPDMLGPFTITKIEATSQSSSPCNTSITSQSSSPSNPPHPATPPSPANPPHPATPPSPANPPHPATPPSPANPPHPATKAQTQINPGRPTTHSCSPDTFTGSKYPEEQVIHDIWEGKKQNALWSKMGLYKLFTKNLMGLAPGKWLESEVVNGYLHHLKN